MLNSNFFLKVIDDQRKCLPVSPRSLPPSPSQLHIVYWQSPVVVGGLLVF
jgi:hypothetical protein